MEVFVDREKCTGLGVCESLAPLYFEVDEDGELVLLRSDVSEEHRAAVVKAVRGCPNGALRMVP
jgi:ferredoxin